MLRFCCVFLLLISCGCKQRMFDLNMISNKQISLNKVDLDALPQNKNIEGVSSRYMVLGFPIGFPTLEEAVDDALRKGDGDLMIDSVFYRDHWTIILFGQQFLSVQGTVVETRGAAARAQGDSGTTDGDAGTTKGGEQ